MQQKSRNQHKLLLDFTKKHFPLQHKLWTLFNKNTANNRYSCMQKIKTIINSYHESIFFSKKVQNIEHVIKQKHLSINTKMLTTNTIYKGKVTLNNQNHQEKVYFGL